MEIRWQQEKFGHPGNWTEEATDFCLRTFIHVAVRIQDADWIPGAIPFAVLYEHRVTALEDDVVLFKRPPLDAPPGPFEKYAMKKGESIVGHVEIREGRLTRALLRREGPQVIDFNNEELWGQIVRDKVRVTCVPRDSELIGEAFSNLPEIEWEPED